MIAWWWLLVGLGGMWAVLLTAACVADRQVREEVMVVVCSVLLAPVAVVSTLIMKIDVGAMRISPRAVSRFAAQRSADKRPAWLFWSRGRGILIVRSWKLGSDRPVVRVRDEWQQSSGEEAR